MSSSGSPSQDDRLCQEFQDRLPDLLEEELQETIPAADRDRLLGHARSCPSCAEAMRSYRSLLEKLHALPRSSARPDLAEVVLRRIAAQTGAPSGGEPLSAGTGGSSRILLRLAAALALAASIGYAGWRWSRREEPVQLAMEAARPANEDFLEAKRSARDAEEAPPSVEVDLAPADLRAGAVSEITLARGERIEPILERLRAFAPGGAFVSDRNEVDSRSRLIEFEITPADLPALRESLAEFDGAEGPDPPAPDLQARMKQAPLDTSAAQRNFAAARKDGDAPRQDRAAPPAKGAAPSRRAQAPAASAARSEPEAKLDAAAALPPAAPASPAPPPEKPGLAGSVKEETFEKLKDAHRDAGPAGSAPSGSTAAPPGDAPARIRVRIRIRTP